MGAPIYALKINSRKTIANGKTTTGLTNYRIERIRHFLIGVLAQIL